MAGFEHTTMQNEEGNDKTVSAFVKRFPIKHEKALQNYFGEWVARLDGQAFGGNLMSGSIKDFVLQHTIKEIKQEDEEIRLRPNMSVWDQLPDLRNDLTGQSVGEWLVEVSVKHNLFLGRDDNTSMVFAKYLPENIEKRNPIRGSSNEPLPTMSEETQPPKLSSQSSNESTSLQPIPTTDSQ